MPFIAKSITVSVDDTDATLDFGCELSAWVYGVTSFDFYYGGDDDHHIDTLGLSVTVSPRNITVSAATATDAAVTKTVFTVSAKGTLRDLSNDNIDTSKSQVIVTVLGYSGIDPGTIALKNLGNVNGGTTYDMGFPPSVGCEAVLAGFTVSFGTSKGDQHLMDESVAVKSQPSGNSVQVTGTAGIEDAGDGSADGTLSEVDAGLIAIGGAVDQAGIEFQFVDSQDSSTSVTFSQPLTSAGAFILSETVAYSQSEDFHVYQVGAGPTACTVNSENSTKVDLTRPGGQLADKSDHVQDDNLTKVKLLVVGCFTPAIPA